MPEHNIAIQKRLIYRTWRLVPTPLQGFIRTGFLKAIDLAGEIVQLIGVSSQTTEHPFLSFVHQDLIHSTAVFTGSICNLYPGCQVKIGEYSIFRGNLHFYQAGSFDMGARSYVGPNTSLHLVLSMRIGDDVMISSGCTFIDSDMHSVQFSERRNDVLIAGSHEGLLPKDKNWNVVESKPICIQNKVWIGLNAIVLKGVTVGEGAIVGAGSVVSKDVPPWTMVAGNPAQVIRVLEVDKADVQVRGKN